MRGSDELVDLFWYTFAFAKHLTPINAFGLIIEVHRIVLWRSPGVDGGLLESSRIACMGEQNVGDRNRVAVVTTIDRCVLLLHKDV
jgi:hypothetical protein